MHTKRKLLLIGLAVLIAACESKPPVGPGVVTITQTTSSTTSTSTSTIPAPTTATFALSTEMAIVGQLVLVNGSASTAPSGRSIDTYSWDWGDGAITSGLSSFHGYSLAGVYTITLTVTDTEGDTGASFKVVTVDPAPTTTSTILPTTTTIPGGGSGTTTTTTETGGGTTTTTAPPVISPLGRERAQGPDSPLPAAMEDRGVS